MHQVDLFKKVYGSPQGRRELEAVIHYLRERGTKATGKVTRRVLGCVLREQRVEALMWTEGQRLRAEGRRQGREEGRIEGLAKGRAEGRVEGLAEGVLRVLAARALYVDGESRERILGCTDLALLDRWLKRALRANHLSDVLARRSVTGKRATRSRPLKAKSGGKAVAGGSPKRGRRQ
ncbi:hypothetical protein [Archangium sp. Cb G35]|uniref:hypothetical protein n=1 Tax=Archangium sp. Cb G35 TaxID=1920190 RepID=UPI000B230810|nr:hypothetical protein [Archangium sp. Cb G35]